ncbi:MAG: RIP metalloprotease RseP [Myxococcales bacterium]
MSGLPAYVAYFLLLVGPLVLFHELGHFAIAKWCGVKVTRFSFGFGPRLLGFRHGETEYRLSLLPLGGYVKMAGDNPAEPLPEADKGRGFLEAPPWKRMAIAVAGPAMNLILPAIVFFVTALAFQHQGVAPYVGGVLPGSPADRAGVRPGDVILSIDGKPVRAFEDIRDLIGTRVDAPLAVVVRRGERELPLAMTPTSMEEQDEIETTHRGMIGIRSIAPPATVGVIDPASPAYAAGLRTFDRVVSVDGKPVGDGLELERLLAEAPGKLSDVVALRGRALGYPGLGPGVIEPVHARFAFGPQAGLELDDLYVRWVLPGSPAAKAGIRAGDRVTALDGKPLVSWWGLEDQLKKIAKAPLTLTVEAPGQAARVIPLEMATLDLGESQVTGGRIQVLTLGLLHDGEPLLPSDRALPRDWIFPSLKLVPLHTTVGEALGDSVSATVEVSRKEILGLVRMFQGRISVKQLGGPLMIADVARQAAQEGAAAFLFMMTLLSINLGLLNLLPLPALDGGHIATALIEAVRRKPLSMRAREVTQAFGLVLLVALMAFVIINDFVQKRGPSLYP